MCLASPKAGSVVGWSVFEWFYSVVLCSIAIPSNHIPNIYPRIHMTCVMLWSTHPSSFFGCIGLCRVCVFECMLSMVGWLCLNGTRCSMLSDSEPGNFVWSINTSANGTSAGAHVARSIKMCWRSQPHWSKRCVSVHVLRGKIQVLV